MCDEILEGQHDDQFPLVIWQTGSGTQSNMNVNEVIANRAHQLAGKRVGEGEDSAANDDVNRSQSSNDTFPTAMHIAGYKMITEVTLPGVAPPAANAVCQGGGDGRGGEDRAHPPDGCHPTHFGAGVQRLCPQLDYGIRAVEHTLPHLAELALGGTAVGTGLNTPRGYDEAVARYIAAFTGLPFVTAQQV